MELFTIINTFVNKMGYDTNTNVEGIVFYGSSQTGFSNDFSDIDLHIIFKEIKHEIRGSYQIGKYRIEYFEKQLKSMYDKADYEFTHQANALVSMILFGNIILDRNGEIAQLQQYIKTLYANPLPKLEVEKAKEQIAIINNFFDDLKFLINTNNIYAFHVYHLALERIKDLYYAIHGLAGVSRTKALRVMLDDNYRKAIKKDNPEEEFIQLYLQCLNEKVNINERFLLLCDLFHFTIKNISFNKNTHRIQLK